MSHPDVQHAPVATISVPLPRISTSIDDRTPACMASRMGAGSRLAILAFGLGPIVGNVIASVLAFVGGYGALLAIPELAWLTAPGLLPLFSLAALGLYSVLALNNPRLSSAAKGVWLTLILLAAPIAIPAYWFAQVWNAPEAEEH